jgi:hypothetical protein
MVNSEGLKAIVVISTLSQEDCPALNRQSPTTLHFLSVVQLAMTKGSCCYSESIRDSSGFQTIE